MIKDQDGDLMKRKLIIGIFLALSLVSLVSCESNDDIREDIIETPSGDTVIEDADDFIDIIEIDSELDLNLNNVSTISIDTEYENDLKKFYTVYVLYNNNTRKVIKIDAMTGEILSSSNVEEDDSSFQQQISNPDYSLDDIKNIALNAVGGTGVVKGMELVTEDNGLIYYDVSIVNGNTNYDVHIDATSSSVISYEEDSLMND